MAVSFCLIKRLLLPFIAGLVLIIGLSGHFSAADASMANHHKPSALMPWKRQVAHHLSNNYLSNNYLSNDHVSSDHVSSDDGLNDGLLGGDRANDASSPPTPPPFAVMEFFEEQNEADYSVAGMIETEHHNRDHTDFDHMMFNDIAFDDMTFDVMETSANILDQAQQSPLSKSIDSGIASKSIAIDSDSGVGVDPNVSQLNPVQLAAQIWASASFPVEQFQSYTSPFGYRASPSGGYRREFHYGLDIAAPRSSYIRNWWSGSVLEVSDGGNCGTSVVIQSGEWMHMYCHMQGHVENRGGRLTLVDGGGDIQIWQGQEVVAGDRIGRVGMTGRTTGPHLHWGLKYQGHWVDPAWVLQAMAASHHALYGQ